MRLGDLNDVCAHNALKGLEFVRNAIPNVQCLHG
jgi:hypothetical protein